MWEGIVEAWASTILSFLHSESREQKRWMETESEFMSNVPENMGILKRIKEWIKKNVWMYSRKENKGIIPYHGRASLHIGENDEYRFKFEYNFWSSFCGISVGLDSQDDNLKFHIAFPPISLWLGVPTSKQKGYVFGYDYFDISFHDWTLFWKFDTGMDWDSKTPRWKDGSFDFADFFLGKWDYKENVLSTHEVKIPMPEGEYDATIKLHEDTWKRPRWIMKRMRRAHITIPKGIPHQGKGENSWDCGEDRTFGMTASAKTLTEAVELVRKDAMRDRERYDHGETYPEPQGVLE